MDLTSKQRRHLRSLAHHLKPVVILGDAGMTEATTAKIVFELRHHELIKVKVNDGPEGAREVGPKLAEAAHAALVQVIGKTVVLYRRRKKDPEIRLPTD